MRAARTPLEPQRPAGRGRASRPTPPTRSRARLYREAARFARRAGLRLATHVAESPAEVELLARGTGPHRQGLRLARAVDGRPLDSARPAAGASTWPRPGRSARRRSSSTACRWTTADVAVLAASGAAVAHCPRSNARLRCGVAPVAELLAAGVTVGLGTDSLASNDSLDMFAEMRAALAATGRPRDGRSTRAAAARPAAPRRGAACRGQPRVAHRREVLRMATLEGARALGWADQVGSLEAGKSADIIAVRLAGRGCQPTPAASRPQVDAKRPASAAQRRPTCRLTMVDGPCRHSRRTRPRAARSHPARRRPPDARCGARAGSVAPTACCAGDVVADSRSAGSRRRPRIRHNLSGDHVASPRPVLLGRGRAGTKMRRS